MSSRRTFLGQAAAAGALVSTPHIWSSSYAVAQDANSKLSVASIGVGGSRGRYNRGGNVARQAAKLGQMISVCDVDSKHSAEFSDEFGGKPTTYVDYREMLEKEKPNIVTIGTPDHWHIPIAMAALRSGAHVYCEKPLTLTIQEGIDICKVVKETGKIFQVGTQQRSEMDKRFLKAIAIVQSGRLGKNVNAYVAIGGAPSGGDKPFPSKPVPGDLDWDMWLGPAPKVDYCEERRRMFRWWFEYSGGKMTDWGAHHIDIAQWALGKGDTGPISASAKGKFPPLIPAKFNWPAFLNGEATLPNTYNTATNFSIDLKFADGALLQVNDEVNREDGVKFGNGILFEGENGRIFVNRGKLQGKIVDDMSAADKEEIDEAVQKLYKGKRLAGHMQNFYDCIDDGSDPISDVYSHHRTMTSCHLCNIALMLGRDLKWDPKAQTFIGDDQAVALMSRKSRELALATA